MAVKPSYGPMLIIQKIEKLLVEEAALLLSGSLEACIDKKGSAVMAVPGGRSVADIFRRLGAYRLDWQKVRIFMLDERLVPIDHPDSNYKLVNDAFGKAIPPGTIVPFYYDAENPPGSLHAYGESLKCHGGSFDIVLASSGEDGHIGSLFPDHHSVREKGERFILVADSPKPPPARMTAGVDLLCRAETGILLFFGHAKRRALKNFLDDTLSYYLCPAKIMTMMANYYVLTDQEMNSP